MIRLRMRLNDVDGAVQRTIFEFSRRDIRLAGFTYRQTEDGGIIEIEAEERAASIVKHLKRIYGVSCVEMEN